MKLNLCTIDWVAIGSIATGAMAIATFVTLRNNKKQFVELQKQNFENTLFQLLHEVKKLLSEVSNIPPEGRKKENYKFNLLALEDVYNRLRYGMTHKDSILVIGQDEKIEPTKEKGKEVFSIKYNGMSNLGSYFRSLYRLIKFIDESNNTDKEKYEYTSFVRAQLTDIELLWLFYNCTVGHGVDKFKPLVERYTLLKNMPISRLINENHKTWISESAFDKNEKNQKINIYKRIVESVLKFFSNH